MDIAEKSVRDVWRNIMMSGNSPSSALCRMEKNMDINYKLE
jgi:hypothetical protein